MPFQLCHNGRDCTAQCLGIFPFGAGSVKQAGIEIKQIKPVLVHQEIGEVSLVVVQDAADRDNVIKILTCFRQKDEHEGRTFLTDGGILDKRQELAVEAAQPFARFLFQRQFRERIKIRKRSGRDAVLCAERGVLCVAVRQIVIEVIAVLTGQFILIQDCFELSVQGGDDPVCHLRIGTHQFSQLYFGTGIRSERGRFLRLISNIVRTDMHLADADDISFGQAKFSARISGDDRPFCDQMYGSDRLVALKQFFPGREFFYSHGVFLYLQIEQSSLLLKYEYSIFAVPLQYTANAG